MAKRFSIFPYIFPLAVIWYIFSDFISTPLPRNGMLILLIGMLLLLSYQIILYLFLLKDCKDYMFDWGILGKKISYCTVERLTHQSIFSLLVPAALQTILRRSHNMNFCNANVYRSSGTVNRHRVNHDYVDKMKAERLESRKKKVRKKHEIQMVWEWLEKWKDEGWLVKAIRSRSPHAVQINAILQSSLIKLDITMHSANGLWCTTLTIRPLSPQKSLLY